MANNKKKDPYFTNTPWGNLYHDEEFLSHGNLPMVFSLTDTSKQHYLAVCVNFRKDYEWLLMSVEARELIDLITDEVTLSNLLVKEGNQKVHCIWREDAEHPEYTGMAQFPDALLPSDNVNLELLFGEYRHYLHRLESEISPTMKLKR
jgi:hypothetical protein